MSSHRTDINPLTLKCMYCGQPIDTEWYDMKVVQTFESEAANAMIQVTKVYHTGCRDLEYHIECHCVTDALERVARENLKQRKKKAGKAWGKF